MRSQMYSLIDTYLFLTGWWLSLSLSSIKSQFKGFFGKDWGIKGLNTVPGTLKGSCYSITVSVHCNSVCFLLCWLTASKPPTQPQNLWHPDFPSPFWPQFWYICLHSNSILIKCLSCLTERNSLRKCWRRQKYLIISGWQPQTWRQLGGLYKSRGLKQHRFYSSDFLHKPLRCYFCQQSWLHRRMWDENDWGGCGGAGKDLWTPKTPPPRYLLQWPLC